MLVLPNETFEPSNVSKTNREPPNVVIELSYVMLILPNVTLKPFNLSILKKKKKTTKFDNSVIICDVGIVDTCEMLEVRTIQRE